MDYKQVQEYDPTIDDNLPETVTLLHTNDGGKVYLVGTAHFSIESRNDVSKVCFSLHCIYVLKFLFLKISRE